MDHVAIMKKSWGLLPKILSGEKQIESRWSKLKRTPFGKVKEGDVVYFKDSGEPITIKATISKVLEFSNLTPAKIKKILDSYGEADGIRTDEVAKYYDLFKDKKYCSLIFLKKIQEISPFQINKAGFGAMAAWICIQDIQKIKKRIF